MRKHVYTRRCIVETVRNLGTPFSPWDSGDGKDCGTVVMWRDWWESRGLPSVPGTQGMRRTVGLQRCGGTGGNPGDSLQSLRLRGWEGLWDCSDVGELVGIPKGVPGTQGMGRTVGLQRCGGTGGNPGDSLQSLELRGWEELWDLGDWWESRGLPQSLGLRR